MEVFIPSKKENVGHLNKRRAQLQDGSFPLCGEAYFTVSEWGERKKKDTRKRVQAQGSLSGNLLKLGYSVSLSLTHTHTLLCFCLDFWSADGKKCAARQVVHSRDIRPWLSRLALNHHRLPNPYIGHRVDIYYLELRFADMYMNNQLRCSSGLCTKPGYVGA